MKTQFGLSLKLFLLAITVVCVAVGIHFRRHVYPLRQKEHVAELLSLGERSPGDGSEEPFINVWYDNQLQWNDSESRFVISDLLARQRVIPDDSKHVPVAVEIFCNPDPDELRTILNRLQTVRQVWKSEPVEADGGLESSLDNNRLREWYPNAIISHAQKN